MLFSNTIYDTHTQTGQNPLDQHNISWSGTISLFIVAQVMCFWPIREQEFGMKSNKIIYWVACEDQSEKKNFGMKSNNKLYLCISDTD